MEIRSLRPSEREAWLELLDGWDVGDGWRGADFFRRYVEDDPSYDDRNVFAAFDAGRPVSCVQVFPRGVHLRGRVVPLGGIGSVFTDPAYRRRGLAEALLHRAVAAMTSRGMELSLLFAARTAWYAKLGWTLAPGRRQLLRGPARGSQPGEPFVAGRDLAQVRALHAAYSSRLDGSVARDDALWQASLRNAGNPDETFRVARQGDRVLAYVRTARLGGFENLLELGRAEGAEAALADLVADRVGELLVAPSLEFEPGLHAALERRGVRAQPTPDPTPMWRCLDAAGLARRLGEAPGPGESPAAWLRRLLPPERALFWTADRF